MIQNRQALGPNAWIAATIEDSPMGCVIGISRTRLAVGVRNSEPVPLEGMTIYQDDPPRIEIELGALEPVQREIVEEFKRTAEGFEVNLKFTLFEISSESEFLSLRNIRTDFTDYSNDGDSEDDPAVVLEMMDLLDADVARYGELYKTEAEKEIEQMSELLSADRSRKVKR